MFADGWRNPYFAVTRIRSGTRAKGGRDAARNLGGSRGIWPGTKTGCARRYRGAGSSSRADSVGAPLYGAISKTTAGTGDTDPYKVTIINKYSAEKATKAEITIPAGWVVPAAGRPVSADEGSLERHACTSGKIVATDLGRPGLRQGSTDLVQRHGWDPPGVGICSGGPLDLDPEGIPRLDRLQPFPVGSAPKVTVSKPGRLSKFGLVTAGERIAAAAERRLQRRGHRV